MTQRRKLWSEMPSRVQPARPQRVRVKPTVLGVLRGWWGGLYHWGHVQVATVTNRHNISRPWLLEQVQEVVWVLVVAMCLGVSLVIWLR